ncbi:organic cation transporter-like protein [Macrosteles quadrilineatus]|uniref:organic cation transporter-like protein n=1 Tax=Macrosteles quadrilineatus TaxID=74068 RepID=UPI0023E105D6|nr:organic cation transporter-like protein [Macrosteles quadrilineatus]
MMEWGQYQASASVMMALLKMPAAWLQLSLLYLAPTVNFQCAQPVNKSFPSSNITQEELVFDNSCCFKDEEDQLQFCQQFHYDRRDFTNTVNMMWDLVCEREFLVTFAQVSFMCGVTGGNILGGLAAARVGRKPVLVVALLLMPLLSAVVAVVPTFPLFLLFRFLLGLALGGTIFISFILGNELASGPWRAPISILHQVPFGIGKIIFGLTAYFLRDWREIQMALAVYSLIFLPYCWLIEESPQWLMSKGKLKRAERVTTAIHRRNGLPAIQTEMQPMAEKQKVEIVRTEPTKVANSCRIKETKTLSLCGALCVPRLRRYVLSTWITWYLAGLSFFALNANMPQWGGGVVGGTINIAIGGLIGGIPGNIATIFLVRRFGRKKVTIVAHIFAALFSFLLPIYDIGEQPEDWQRRVTGFLSLIAMSVAYPSLFLMSGELIPDEVKLPVMTVANIMARLGNTTAPLVGPTSVFHRALPLWIIGTAPIISSSLLVWLPETKNKPMPKTVKDILTSKRGPDKNMSEDEDQKLKKLMTECES